MTTRKGLVAFSALAGAVIGMVVYGAVLVPAIQESAPHLYTAKEIEALPEASLTYPGSVLIREDDADQVPSSIEPGQPAHVLRTMSFIGSHTDVMPWFSAQLTSRGWSKNARPQPISAYTWTKGHFTFLLAVCGDGNDGYISSQESCSDELQVGIYAG